MTRHGRDPDVPVLFLDFDGVLHPDEVYRVGDKIVLKMDGFCLFEVGVTTRRNSCSIPKLENRALD